MAAYYNEIDPFCAQWLRNLIAAGLIAPGDVDERDIREVKPDDVRGYTQCHFFAGIGGWSLALRLAGWSDDGPVWTGSCPCQPFSAAGKRKGAADERHLWPYWYGLIRERMPSIIFGEQVARAIGKTWLDAVAHDLEQQNYAFGAAILPACSVGAPHRRNRIWFVADASSAELRHKPGRSRRANGAGAAILRDDGTSRSMAHADGSRWAARDGNLSAARYRRSASAGGNDGHADSARLAFGQSECRDTCAEQPAAVGADWWSTEPDVGRVAHGVSARVDKLRALGNAIVPQVAAEFIKAATDDR